MILNFFFLPYHIHFFTHITSFGGLVKIQKIKSEPPQFILESFLHEIYINYLFLLTNVLLTLVKNPDSQSKNTARFYSTNIWGILSGFQIKRPIIKKKNTCLNFV